MESKTLALDFYVMCDSYHFLRIRLIDFRTNVFFAKQVFVKIYRFWKGGSKYDYNSRTKQEEKSVKVREHLLRTIPSNVMCNHNKKISQNEGKSKGNLK